MKISGPAVDISGFIPENTATMEIMRPGGLEGTGWHVEFGGPAHPKTIAYNDAQQRRNLRKAQQMEQAQVNGRKFKAEEKEPDDVRRENVAWVVARIVDWTPVRLGGEEIAFSDEAATELLLRRELGWALGQMVEYLADERSFTKGSAKTSEPSPSTTSPSEA